MQTWQEREQGEVAQSFARFVDSWEEYKTHIAGSGEACGDTEIYNMTADGVPFSFRRVGNKQSLIYGGVSELIHADTFAFWKESIQKFFKDSLPKLS